MSNQQSPPSRKIFDPEVSDRRAIEGHTGGKMPKSILERPLAFTDVETTGLDPIRFYVDLYRRPLFVEPWHEIVEIGLILVDQDTLTIQQIMDFKVKPEHPEMVSPEALQVNGYNEAEWRDAPDLASVMRLYGQLTEGAMIANQNVTFDCNFIDAAFKMTGVECKMDYHKIDIFSMAWGKLRNCGLQYFNLDGIAEFFGMPKEPLPHRAINGAMRAFEVYNKKLMEI